MDVVNWVQSLNVTIYAQKKSSVLKNVEFCLNCIIRHMIHENDDVNIVWVGL